MQRFKFLFVSFTIATIGLLSYVVFAQNKTQSLPVVISAVAPVYPAVAVALKLEGDFRVDVEVDRSGKVVSSKAVEGTNKYMREVIEKAADRWEFAPNENAEKRRRVQLTFNFHYTPEESGVDSTAVFYPPYKIAVRENTVLETTPSY